MTNRFDLLTDQDFHAFADGEVTPDRAAAIERCVAVNARRRAEVEGYQRARDALRSCRHAIYARDKELAQTIEALIARVASPTDQDGQIVMARQ